MVVSLVYYMNSIDWARDVRSISRILFECMNIYKLDRVLKSLLCDDWVFKLRLSNDESSLTLCGMTMPCPSSLVVVGDCKYDVCLQSWVCEGVSEVSDDVRLLYACVYLDTCMCGLSYAVPRILDVSLCCLREVVLANRRIVGDSFPFFFRGRSIVESLSKNRA